MAERPRRHLQISIYQQNQPYKVMADWEVVLGIRDDADDKMFALMVKTKHPVLITLEQLPTIVKPVEEGDHEVSFIALYDTCYTFVDLQRMQRRGAETPEAAQLDTYRVDLHVAVDGYVTVSVWTRAHNHGDARRRVDHLISESTEVGEAIKQAVLRDIDENASGDRFPNRVVDCSNNVPQLDESKEWDVTLPREDRDRE